MTILTPKSEMTLEQLHEWAVDWSKRWKKERNIKRKQYCLSQSAEAVHEMMSRNIDIVKEFEGSDVLDLFIEK